MSKAFARLTVLFWIASSSAGAEVRNLDRTVALDLRGTVSLQTFKGSIEIETWGEPRAEIHARIEPDTTCGTEADQEERVRLTEVEVVSSADRVSLRSNYDRLEHLWSIPFHVQGFDSTCNAYPFVRYRLRIPETAELEIEDHKSNISVRGLNAAARIRTHKGVVNVTGQKGALDLLTHKGKVHVEFEQLAGGSRLETYKGDIEVAVPRAAGFDLDARVARSGTLEAPFSLDERQVSRHERVYEQKINGGGSRLELTTGNGSLRITER
jgi:hypothetical protein